MDGLFFIIFQFLVYILQCPPLRFSQGGRGLRDVIGRAVISEKPTQWSKNP